MSKYHNAKRAKAYRNITEQVQAIFSGAISTYRRQQRSAIYACVRHESLKGKVGYYLVSRPFNEAKLDSLENRLIRSIVSPLSKVKKHGISFPS